MGLDAVVEKVVCETDDARSRAVQLWGLVVAAYGKPGLPRKLIRQAVESEGRNKADNGLRDALAISARLWLASSSASES
ncbi:hypothetical protein ATY29_08045 [Rhizobium hidalgonense]|nr:hypothetical protein ATY29_08045 [Rhizobium hidalgonense]